MKILLAVLSLICAFTTAAQADTIQVNETFINAQKWLNERKLAVTGGPNGARDDDAAFSQKALLFYGEAVGNPENRTIAQREINAKRAAVVTAQRALAEYLAGFTLIGDTLVKDGMVQHDMIRSAVAGFVRGSQVVFQEYNKENDTAIAFVKLGLHGPKGFASTVYEKIFSDPNAKEVLNTDKPAFKVQPVKLDEAYDGLIIDATEQNFRPALINRIFATKGDVLYDPAKVSQKVLVEQGCGEYTNSVDKAKAALESRGVKKPLIVKASGATTVADLQVTDDDAVTIYSADQKGKFFSSAKVAFVLK